MNKFIGIGRLTKEGELRTTDNNKNVYRNSIAIRNDFKNKNNEYDSEFFNFVSWGANADYLNKYATKGSLVMIEGRLTSRKYEANDGIIKYVTEIVTEKAQILEKKESIENELPKNINTEYDIEESTVKLTDDDIDKMFVKPENLELPF